MDNRLTPRNFSVRLTKEAERQLEALMQKWGENRSQAIIRTIALAHNQEKDYTIENLTVLCNRQDSKLREMLEWSKKLPGSYPDEFLELVIHGGKEPETPA